MSESVRRMLVAYDIADDSRRDRVAVALQHYGERVQYSVFVIDGRPADFVRLRAELTGLVDVGTDSILLCDLGSRAQATQMKIEFIGTRPRLTGDSSALIV